METENKQLLRWSSQKHFVCALICWTVGLGNCWRFPLLTTIEGSGAFLIPYAIQLICISIPLTYLELGVGQYSNKGPIAVWAICPIWRGLGFATIFNMSIWITYYNVVCTYLLFFLGASFSGVLPWSVCDPSWAKVNCYTYADNLSIQLNCIEQHGANYCLSLKWKNSAVQYWEEKVMGKDLVHGLGKMQWHLVICNSITMFLVFLINCKGTRSIEKVILFLAVFPYIELVILLFVTLIDPGSGRGIKAMMTFDFTILSDRSTWQHAAEQITFSMGLGFGGLITLGSQSQFRNPIHMQAIMINLIDFASSLCYTLFVYNCIGCLSYELNIPMKEVLAWPDTLLFARIPHAILYLPGMPPLWAILFYSGIYLIGLRSQCLMVATILMPIYVHFPKTLKYTGLCSAAVCTVINCVGFFYLTQFGSILLNIVDNAVGGPNALLNASLETIGILWIYGLVNFVDDLHFMLGFRASAYWKICWSVAPALLLAMGGMSLYTFLTELQFNEYTLWTKYLSWCIFAVPTSLLITFFVAHVIKQRKSKKVMKVFKPAMSWGPVDPILKKSREMFSAHSMTKEYMYRQNRMRLKVGAEDNLADDYSNDSF